MVGKRKATFTPTDPRGMAAREELIPPGKEKVGLQSMSMEKNSQKIETSASVKACCLVFKIQAQLLKRFHTLTI